jgi:putative SOS response-associated peptidase YedK
MNAMAETIASKPAVRDAFKRGQRCIVPVYGLYEWQKAVRWQTALCDRWQRRQARWRWKAAKWCRASRSSPGRRTSFWRDP